MTIDQIYLKTPVKNVLSSYTLSPVSYERGDSGSEVLETGNTKGFTSQRLKSKGGGGPAHAPERLRCLSSSKDIPWFQHALNILLNQTLKPFEIV